MLTMVITYVNHAYKSSYKLGALLVGQQSFDTGHMGVSENVVYPIVPNG